MSASINRVILSGRVGRDAEVRYSPSGNAVCNFSLATSERYKDKSGDWKESTEWHRCVMFGAYAEACGKFLLKGVVATVEGKLVTRKWEKDGESRYTTEVVAEKVVALGEGASGSGQRQQRQESDKPYVPPASKKAPDEPFQDDDIPF